MFVICGRQPSSNRTLSHTFCCCQISAPTSSASALPSASASTDLPYVCATPSQHCCGFFFCLLSLRSLVPCLCCCPTSRCALFIYFAVYFRYCFVPNLIYKSKRLFCRCQRDVYSIWKWLKHCCKWKRRRGVAFK